MDIIGWIEQAKAKKVNVLVFQNNTFIKARKGTGFVANFLDQNLSTPVPIRRNEILELTKSLVTTQQFQSLNELGFVQGYRNLGVLSVKYTIIINDVDIVLILKWRSPHLEESSRWDVNQKILSQIGNDGVTIISGPAKSGKTTFTSHLTKEFLKEKRKLVGIFADCPDEYESFENRSRFKIDILKNSPNPAHEFDVVVLDSSQVFASTAAIRISEAGRKVILVQDGRDLLNGLQIFLDSTENGFCKRRLVDSVNCAFGVKLIDGIEQEIHPVFEFLSINRQTKVYLENSDWNSLVELVQGSTEYGNVQTMNQSLIAGLLRRKIDLKASFDNTPNPEVLNEMLKKIGI